MKIFIQKIILFIGILFVIIMSSIYTTNNIINKNANFKLSNNVKSIIVGHSHPECAFNDTLLTNFKNFSQSGESYFYTYQKVKKILSQNNQIENIFIEFTNNQISESMDKWIWGDIYMSYRFPKYAPFMKNEEHRLLISNNFNSYYFNLSILLKNNISNIRKSDNDFTSKIGGYHWLESNKTDSLIANINKIEVDDMSFFRLSSKNIEYLEKIVNYCKDNDVKLYFIRSPQHKYYSLRKNEKILIRIKNEKFKDIDFLDFNNFPLKNSEFGDLEHLNHHGAKVFSLWFNKIILKGVLQSKNKKKYINAEIVKHKHGTKI